MRVKSPTPRRMFATAAATVTIATVAVQLPWYVRSAVMPGVGVRLMSANLLYGRADADAVVRMAREHADILAGQEVTPEKADLMSAAGLDDAFSFQAGIKSRAGLGRVTGDLQHTSVWCLLCRYAVNAAGNARRSAVRRSLRPCWSSRLEAAP
jgi:hypothetical protein